jgi:catechol 2,3-dioxygenase-like lactoylglutathione lyase family enzyme
MLELTIVGTIELGKPAFAPLLEDKRTSRAPTLGSRFHEYAPLSSGESPGDSVRSTRGAVGRSCAFGSARLRHEKIYPGRHKPSSSVTIPFHNQHLAGPSLYCGDLPMLSHVHVGISDFIRSYAFYSALFEVLGLELKFYQPQQFWAGWGAATTERPLFFIGLPFDRQPARSGNGHMTAFLAVTRDDVDRCHAAALANGGSCEGPPGLRPQYHAHYYGAYVRDPDGNKICVCCHK